MASPRTTGIYWSEQVIRIGELCLEIVLADSSMPPSGANWVLDNALHELSERLRSFKIGHMPLIALVLVLRVSLQGNERPEDEVMCRICQLPTCWVALKIDSAISHTRTRASENLPSTITMQKQLTLYYKQYSCTQSSFSHAFSGKTITYRGRLDRLPFPWFTIPGLALFDAAALHLQCELSRQDIEELELYSRVNPSRGSHSALRLNVERLAGSSSYKGRKPSTPHPLYNPDSLSWRSRIVAFQIESMRTGDGSAASQVHC